MRHGLHGFALDQPSINEIGPINPSEKMKRSETVGNSRKHDQAKTCPTRISFLKINISAQRSFFLKVQRCPRGNGWKQSEIAPSLGKKDMFLHNFQTFFMNICTKQRLFCRAKVRSPTVSNRFPLDTFGPSKKKLRCAEMFIFKKKCGLDKFWPDHVSDCFRPFPTVSFFLKDWLDQFHLWKADPVQTRANHDASWRLSFFVRPLCAYTAPNIASWPWYPIFPKNHKIPGAREI